MDATVAGFREQVAAHAASAKPLCIRGGGTKSFYGGAVTKEAQDEVLEVGAYSGIIDYQPKELVLTVRAGTPLAEVEAALREAGQILPFEPPHYGAGSTIGGVVATGLSGPRRPYTGAVRDFVLGARIIDGRGDDLQFGGRVIKNVAGYDVSRLMCGAMGTLGILLDLSFKTLPKPVSETTLRFEMDEATAIRRFNEWAGKPLPLSAASWHEGTSGGVAMLRLSGAAAGVSAACEKLGGEKLDEAAVEKFWRDLREQSAAFFQSAKPLWRLSLPPTTAPLALDGPQWIDWGGALRWFPGTVDAKALRAKVEAVGGHATLFRGGDKTAGVFHPLAPTLAKLHRNLKSAFDPKDIFNRGRMDNF